jgi:DNA-binding transcriptional MocR family regulator
VRRLRSLPFTVTLEGCVPLHHRTSSAPRQPPSTHHYNHHYQDLGHFLTDEYKLPVAADHLFITGGNSMAISLVARTYVTKGSQDDVASRVVFMEDPSYFLAKKIFTDLGIVVKGFPVDDDGLRVDLVEAALTEGARPRLVYIIPSYHNPTGTNLSLERRKRIVELSVKYDFKIISDEPYVLLKFSEVDAPSMMKFDLTGESVICLGSFSKILAPGLRLGWVRLALTSHRNYCSGSSIYPRRSCTRVLRTFRNCVMTASSIRVVVSTLWYKLLNS